MKCSICGKDVNATFSPDGKIFYCGDCNKQRCLNKCLVSAKFEKSDGRATGSKYLLSKQVERHSGRIKAGREKCLECKRRKSCKDIWIEGDTF